MGSALDERPLPFGATETARVRSRRRALVLLRYEHRAADRLGRYAPAVAVTPDA